MRKKRFLLMRKQRHISAVQSDSTIPLLLIANIPSLSSLEACLCDCTDRFVSDQVGNPKTGFLASRPPFIFYQLRKIRTLLGCRQRLIVVMKHQTTTCKTFDIAQLK